MSIFTFTGYIGFLVLIVGVFFFFLQRYSKRIFREYEAARVYLENIRNRCEDISKKYTREEERAHNVLKLYEVNREISEALNFEELLRAFQDALLRIENIQEVVVSPHPLDEKKYFVYHYKAANDLGFFLGISSDDRRIVSQVPYLLSQLNLFLERAKLYEKMQRLSITDTLTKIANRRHLMERFGEEFSRATRLGLSLSFMMVDIDHFKYCNDTYGHMVGDVVLKKIARILKDNIREIDFIGRFGGEEFAVILPEATTEISCRVAERLREKVAKEEITAYDEHIHLTLSIGVAGFPGNTGDSAALIELADKALYKAKKEGRNRVCCL